MLRGPAHFQQKTILGPLKSNRPLHSPMESSEIKPQNTNDEQQLTNDKQQTLIYIINKETSSKGMRLRAIPEATLVLLSCYKVNVRRV